MSERLVYKRPANQEQAFWLADQVKTVLAYRIGIGDWPAVQAFCQDLLIAAFENGCFPERHLKLDDEFAKSNKGACRARVAYFCASFLAPAVMAEKWQHVASGAQVIYGVAWANQQP